MSIDQNQNLASVFELIADLLELLDENQFKISAYRNSARIFQGLTKPIEDLLFSGELKNITGIGKASIEKAKEYISTGKISYLEELTKLVPLGLLELLKIKGLGPKKVKLLWKNLNITSLGELEYACKENRLILLKGFGEKTQTNVLNYIEFLKKGSAKFLINKIFFEQSKFEEFLKSLNNISLFSPIGINRRFFEVYDSINYLISSNNHKNLVNNFKNYFNDIIYSNSKISAKLNDIVFNIYLTDNNSFYSNLFIKTGNDNFLDNIKKYLKIKNIKINNELFLHNEKVINFKNEYDIFQILDLPFIRPELRDYPNFDEMLKYDNLEKRIDYSDLKGALHIHTTYSDGYNSIEEMVKNALERGFEYIGICDHSQSAFYANGLNKERIFQQFSEIDTIQKKYPKIKILKGIESDISKDGSLDYPDDVLKKFDFIIASIHSYFNLNYEDMTKRLVNAAQNKYTTIIGHPTGRLLLSRDSYKFDWDRLIQACKENNTALELNSDEHRLDVPYEKITNIVKNKVKIAINSDAHNISSLDNLHYGIALVNKALTYKDDILNTLSFNDFIKAINKHH